jgi:hypothetical protein
MTQICRDARSTKHKKFNSLSAWLSDQNVVNIYLLRKFLEGSKLGRVIKGYPEHLVLFLCLFATTIGYYTHTQISAFQIPTEGHNSTPLDAMQSINLKQRL